ncbi:MAG: DEAD/DEAH box helicase [Waddliaceae bacterium]|jgi:superfamily II DNA/RNA helicase|nr:DEAD/DEAH box helicase [Waddliaceae bacterium]MBT6928161.1 DEAD/DEAH box helicase [Waddliaceae bacterium]
MSFSDLNLNSEILKTIEEAGYTTPTPVQKQVIPKVLEGRDLRASAPTGTGKTAAFILPALNRIMTEPETKGRGPRILILVPTRELAMQVASQASKYSKRLPRVKTVCIYGGAPYYAQNRDLAGKYEILVATPGRLIDHIERGKINFSRLELLVLDEADRMLDMGFIEPVELIASKTPSNRQTLLFSATLKGSVLKLSERLLNNPMEITVRHSKEEYENIEQRMHYVDDIYHKQELLNHFLEDQNIEQALIFTSTKIQADQLANQLNEFDHKVAALHGDMNQRQRTRTIMRMREGKIKILVATDVAARGIDVKTISHVINFDMPMNPEDYVHRIGRTGRAGCKGLALSFVSSRDYKMIKIIEHFTGQQLDFQTVPGMEPKKKMMSSTKPMRKKRPFSKTHRNNRPSSSTHRNKKPYSSATDGNKRSYSSEQGTKKPFASRTDGNKRPYSSEQGTKKPFASRTDGNKRPYSPSQGTKKPFSSRKSNNSSFSETDGNKKSFSSKGGNKRPFASTQRKKKPAFSATQNKKGGFRHKAGSASKSF